MAELVTFTGSQMNSLFQLFRDWDYMKKEKWIEIDKHSEEHISMFNSDEYPDVSYLLDKLHGFSFKMETYGSHYNDSQIVDYKLTLKTSDYNKKKGLGYKKNFKNRMSLMNGFDYARVDFIQVK